MGVLSEGPEGSKKKHRVFPRIGGRVVDLEKHTVGVSSSNFVRHFYIHLPGR